VSHDSALRMFLQNMPRHSHSPFANVSGTHICRLVVMDDVVFVGSPAKEEHLKSKYLVFNSNLYGGLDALRRLPGRGRSKSVCRLHEEVPDRDYLLLRRRQRQDR
jgi:hypothetical protein